MKNVLAIKSSILGSYSQSGPLVDYFLAKLNANVTAHDVGSNPLPYYDGNAASGIRGFAENDAQKQAVALSDKLIGEVKSSDLLVFGVPMYNLSVPAQLKTYLDYICRAGETFAYTAEGVKGLVEGKKAVVILTYGGFYQNGAMDLTRQYMQTVLGFIGITDVQFVYAEGFGLGAEAAEKAQTQAKAELDRIAAEI